ncbi:MAG: twin-arginine translocase TatA/TatE family subunit [Thermoanaerobaculia bacterium]
MFGSLGFPELLLIFGVALLIFGPKKMPEIGRSVGKALGEFRRATNDLKSTLEEEVRLEERKGSLTVVNEPVVSPDSVSRGAVPADPAVETAATGTSESEVARPTSAQAGE